jgi:hypothetical protein
MYKRYFEERALIPGGCLGEIRYDDLLQNPINTVRRIYKELGLTSYNESEKDFISFVSAQSSFRTNTHVLNDETREKIASRLQIVFRKLGYTPRL